MLRPTEAESINQLTITKTAGLLDNMQLKDPILATAKKAQRVGRMKDLMYLNYILGIVIGLQKKKSSKIE